VPPMDVLGRIVLIMLAVAAIVQILVLVLR
jgi:hypothetical protein